MRCLHTQQTRSDEEHFIVVLRPRFEAFSLQIRVLPLNLFLPHVVRLFPPLSSRLPKVFWTAMTRKKAENAWVAKVPTWPLTVVFLGQVAGLAGGAYWVIEKCEL